jgi:hypothetical protein
VFANLDRVLPVGTLDVSLQADLTRIVTGILIARRVNFRTQGVLLQMLLYLIDDRRLPSVRYIILALATLA